MDSHEYYQSLPAGTRFIIDQKTLVKMKRNDSHYIHDDLFDVSTGTIHHPSEFILFSETTPAQIQAYINE